MTSKPKMIIDIATKPQPKRLPAVLPAKSLVVDVFGVLRSPRYSISLVPEERIELSWAQGPRDFESRASTNFTTPALLIF